MPSRLRHVRCSVRNRVDSEDTSWAVPKEDWPHDHWDYFSIVPLTGSELFRVGQSGFDANWKVTGRSNPGLQDEDRLVVYVDGVAEMTLEVAKSMSHGRRLIAYAKEISAIQPVVS